MCSIESTGNTMARMKVLLTQDVQDLGLAGEVHAVAGGYARNYLMPRGLAILATKGALKQSEEIRQAGIRRRAQERAGAEAQAEVIQGRRLLFTAKAGETERLYGSVTTADIADRLSEEVGFDVDRRKIYLDHPIRDLGIFDLDIRLMPEVTAQFNVAVVREDETWDDAETRAAEKAAREAAEAQAAAEAEAAAEADETSEGEDEAEVQEA
jgi:large subunit ribosomal protein L9